MKGDKQPFSMFCLATGMTRCDTCQYSSNWDLLNQLPDPLRKALQGKMYSISTTSCAIDHGRFYRPVGMYASGTDKEV